MAGVKAMPTYAKPEIIPEKEPKRLSTFNKGVSQKNCGETMKKKTNPSPANVSAIKNRGAAMGLATPPLVTVKPNSLKKF